VNRREVLGTLGVASAGTLLWAFGCRAPAKDTKVIAASGGEVRTWLHDAIALLAGAGLESPRALAVTRRRTTAAIDVLGAGVSRARSEGVVLSVRDKDGARREQVTSDLSGPGIAAAARTLAGKDTRPSPVEFGMPLRWLADYVEPEDAKLLERVGAIGANDRALSSRIVYQAALLDVDDATVWAVASHRDLQQRLVRVRRAATRVAWNGTRPVSAEVARAWTGGIDDQLLAGDDVSDATKAVQLLATPGAFDDGEYAIVLEPEIVAAIADVATRALLTSAAARRPEVARRLAIGAQIAAPVMTLVDDPTAPGAYGGYQFDDDGELATPVTLIDQGRVVARLAERRRPGHLGLLEPTASHLRFAPGTGDADKLLDAGFVLEGVVGTVVDAASDRVVISIARAKELRAGQPTGRVFADIELVGELGALLASVASVSRETSRVAIRDEADGLPRWRSIEAPWVRARARLRARRSVT
jgi:predicted Zn-dependent protease